MTPRICRCGKHIRPVYESQAKCEDCFALACFYTRVYEPRRARLERTTDDGYQLTRNGVTSNG